MIETDRGAPAPARQVGAVRRHGPEVCAEPVIVLSDLHLNWFTAWQDRLDSLRGLWAGTGTVIFNGDTLDWYTAADGRGGRILGYLRQLCQADGTRPVLLAGNADANLTARRHLFLGGEAVLVTHGDVIFPNLSPWRARAHELRIARQRILQEMAPPRRGTLEGQLASAGEALAEFKAQAVKGVSDAAGMREEAWWQGNPAGILSVLRAWWVTPKMAGRFLARFAPRSRFIVIGHTHRCGVWQRQGRIVINTGSFGRLTRALAVRVADGRLAVQEVVRRKGQCLAGRDAASYILAPGATVASSQPCGAWQSPRVSTAAKSAAVAPCAGPSGLRPDRTSGETMVMRRK